MKFIMSKRIIILLAFMSLIHLDNYARIQTTVPIPTKSSSMSMSDTERIIQNLVDNMVYVPGGTFMMGAAEEDSDANIDEIPAHQVTLSSFHIGKYEVTQEEWEAIMGGNPSSYKGSKHPVEKVSWYDCQEFVIRLNSKTGKRFRLPTEAEWEFAARGGNSSKGYKFSGSDNIDDVAWYAENSSDGDGDGTTHTVGTKLPNELGLYDMSGNVWEWCSDWYGSYKDEKQINPVGAPIPNPDAPDRVFRGGGWCYGPGRCRVSCRVNDYIDCSSYIGLRLVLVQ